MMPSGAVIPDPTYQLSIPVGGLLGPIARYLPNGQLDSTFGTGGRVDLSTATIFGNGVPVNGDVKAVLVQNSGRILVSGAHAMFVCGDDGDANRATARTPGARSSRARRPRLLRAARARRRMARGTAREARCRYARVPPDARPHGRRRRGPPGAFRRPVRRALRPRRIRPVGGRRRPRPRGDRRAPGPGASPFRAPGPPGTLAGSADDRERACARAYLSSRAPGVPRIGAARAGGCKRERPCRRRPIDGVMDDPPRKRAGNGY